MTSNILTQKSFVLTRADYLADYRLAWESRHASLMCRKEVFMGKAKFGIFGDGKELAQIAMARAFRPGDWRSGYYRDQTFMLAAGALTLQEFFAQLYAHTSVVADPATAGRMMNGHFATRSLTDTGDWKDQMQQKNSSADISPTAGQMPRLVGLAYASKLYRHNPALRGLKAFSQNGNEIAFGTIGNAATAEGLFFEAINAAGVLQVPMLTSVWDDGYGISVPNEYQMVKGDISAMLAGLQRTDTESGYEIFAVRGWDYEALCETYQRAARICREQHVPALVHVTELTQPQGHSTSGSHERYKSKERLAWEAQHDCLRQLRTWLLDNGLATADQLNEVEKEARETARQARERAWQAFTKDLNTDHQEALRLLEKASHESPPEAAIGAIREHLEKTINPIRKDAVAAVKKALRALRGQDLPGRAALRIWLSRVTRENEDRYSSHLTSESAEAPRHVPPVGPVYTDDSPLMDGREVLKACFSAALARDPRVFAIGEDVGRIGDVNQGMAGLQEKFGELRVTDTGIREATIVGQGVGAALRGLRPIVEIQYLDYLLYALPTLSDDLACLQYRTKGGQKAPVIIRTRGHRLEGVWHSGSPMGMIIHALRGIHVLVPRNMTQATGFYNTLLQSDDPALVVECLNAYRLKERLPANVGEWCLPLGTPEVLRPGTDVTIVTYGAMCRIVQEAADQLAQVGISCEIIDVQSLLPFDERHTIVESLKKTNRVLFADEDMPGGASAYMLQQVLETQGGYRYLDSPPRTLTAKAHRPAYTTDGDYFSKPNVEDVFDAVYALMQEASPGQFADIYE